MGCWAGLSGLDSGLTRRLGATSSPQVSQLASVLPVLGLAAADSERVNTRMQALMKTEAWSAVSLGLRMQLGVCASWTGLVQLDWNDAASPNSPNSENGLRAYQVARAAYATLIPMVESMLASEPIPSIAISVIDIAAHMRAVAPPGLEPLLPLLGPQCRYLDKVISAYRWPQTHQQALANGIAGDAVLVADIGQAIRLLTLDAGRAETAAQAQLAIFAKALVYDGGVSGLPMFQISTSMGRFVMTWPTLPPGHAEVSALMKQLARDKSCGFAELDLVTPGTMQEQLHAFIASNLTALTKEYGGLPYCSQLHLTSSIMSYAVLAAPHRTAAASVAAELGMSAPDPTEWARQHACMSAAWLATPALAEALLVLGHAESALEFTGEAVRACAPVRIPFSAGSPQ